VRKGRIQEIIIVKQDNFDTRKKKRGKTTKREKEGKEGYNLFKKKIKASGTCQASREN